LKTYPEIFAKFPVWMPVPLYLSGVVEIFAFPRSKSGIFDLTLNKIEHFSKVSGLNKKPICFLSIPYFNPLFSGATRYKILLQRLFNLSTGFCYLLLLRLLLKDCQRT